MLRHTTFGLVGSGNMAEAIISGLLNNNLCKPKLITATGPRIERSVALKKKYKIKTGCDNLETCTSNFLVLAVKPQVATQVFAELSGKIPATTLVISIIAGISLNAIQHGLNCTRVIRAMPNTPGRIGKGITVWTASEVVNKKQKKIATQFFSSLGEEVYVEEEKYLNMATALSGSGPAYAFLFMESLVDAAVRIGLPRYLAEKLVTETVIGSAEYAKAAKEHFAKLRNDVTSPGGTSAEALHQLEKMGFRTAIMEGVCGAYNRSLELGK